MYCHDSGFDSGLIFPPFSHDEMQANIKAANNNNWFPATSKSFCTWKMEGANPLAHDAFLCRESGEEMTLQEYDVINPVRK
jgi:hypothetical protein